jgi:hypothetical protein
VEVDESSTCWTQ